MDLISLLVFLLVLVFVGAVVWWALTVAGLQEPFNTWARLLLALIFVVVLLGAAFGGISVPRFGT